MTPVHPTQAQLQSLAAGEPDPETGTHLARCADCAADLASYRRLYLALSLAAADEDFVDDVMGRVAPPPRILAWIGGLSLAICVLGVTSVLAGWPDFGALGTALARAASGLVQAVHIVTALPPVASAPLVLAHAVLVGLFLFLLGRLMTRPEAVPEEPDALA